MNIGMLWFDNSKDPLDAKIKRAAAYYAGKHGATPNACHVNTTQVPPECEGVAVAGLVLRGSHSIMPNHFWIGCDERQA